MKEIWKQVQEFDRYYVSNLGRVKSVYKHRPEKILKTTLSKKGYEVLSFSKNGIKVYQAVHRLVANAFIVNPKNFLQVNHKDENKLNNNVENLEWCDNFYNQEYSHAKHFEFVSPSGEIVKVFNLNKFCREHGLPVGNMHRLHQGIHKRIKGWTRIS